LAAWHAAALARSAVVITAAHSSRTDRALCGGSWPHDILGNRVQDRAPVPVDRLGTLRRGRS
jgi:hypothetical protein